MAYLDLHAVATHADFIKTVKMAIIKKAASVAGENPESVVTTQALVKRQSLANAVFADAETQSKKFAFHLATYAEGKLSVVESKLVLDESVPDLDAAIDTIIETIWNDRAGVIYTELNSSE